MKPQTLLKSLPLLLICLLTLGLPACFTAVAGQRNLGLRPSETREHLQFTFQARQSSYGVDQPIRFEMHSNRDVYLYLFAIDADLNQAVLLIPGKQHKGHRYAAHRRHVVPDRGLEFYADRPGTEKVLVAASTRWMDVRTARYKALEGFMVTTPSTARRSLRSLKLRAEKERFECIVRELHLPIHGSPRVSEAPLNIPGAGITTTARVTVTTHHP